MASADPAAAGFPALEGARARLLILGSLPGDASIRAQRYYAHPRNAFWPLMEALFGVSGGYRDRSAALIEREIAVWDVLAEATRPGSLDAKIQLASARPNAFQAFFDRHPELTLVACNGAKSFALFKRFVAVPGELAVVSLPSTSPAHASMRFEQKLAAWRDALQDFL